MPQTFRITGRGTAEIAAYGIADAEHQLEKEISAAFPGATLRIEEVRRTDPLPRIVESFLIRYALVVEMAADEEIEAEARRQSFARARNALAGTRFERVEWEKAVRLA